MRRIFTLSLLLLSSVCFSQQGSNTSFAEALMGSIPSCVLAPRQKIDTIKQDRIIMRCQGPLFNSDPLIVVDGLPWPEGKKISDIDSTQIESIVVLRSAPASAMYGYRASNGAIIITTKESKFRKFIIKDLLDGSRIAGATILLISVNDKNEKFQFVANDSGVVVTDRLYRLASYQMTVSSVGHTTQEQNFKNGYNISEKEILLGREIKTCPEVILTQIICWKKIICWGYSTRVIKTGESPGLDLKKELFKVFPNPVSKGGTLNLEFNNDGGKNILIRVMELEGKTILQQKFSSNEGKNVLQLSTDSRWAAGIYFVQLLYENGRVAASGKIILQ